MSLRISNTISMKIFTISVIVVSLTLSVVGALGKEKCDVLQDVVPDAIEFAVLKALYDNQGGVNWTKKTNWPTAGNWPATASSAQFGTWYGIKVENGDIVEINLNANALAGPLPTVISNLQQLRLLTMYNNTAMGGSIPASLTTIPTLQHLNLSNCGLTGTIPSALFNSQVLGILDLQSNALTGGIPTNVGNASNLTLLSLTANRTLGVPFR
jgi:hypothetical protein